MSRRELPERTRLPVPISERFEFVSEQWLDAARTFLQDKLNKLDGNPPTGRFAAIETYTNSPPHLNRPDDVATIHIVIEDGKLDIGYGEVANPTFGRLSAISLRACVHRLFARSSHFVVRLIEQ